MTPADRLRKLMTDDPRPDAEKAEAAGMSRQEWSKYKLGPIVPGLVKAAQILEVLGKQFSNLDD